MKNLDQDVWELARLAAGILPPLYPANWQTITAEELREKLNSELKPEQVSEVPAWVDSHFRTPLPGEETTGASRKRKKPPGPSKFEVIAEAAIRRAQILIEFASGSRTLKPAQPFWFLEQSLGVSAAEKAAQKQFRKRFGKQAKAEVKEAARLVLSRISDRNRARLLEYWFLLSERDRSEKGLEIDPAQFRSGVQENQFLEFKRDLLTLKILDYGALAKRWAREDGSNGGRKSHRLSTAASIRKRAAKT